MLSFSMKMKPRTYWWIAAPKSMAQRPQAQGAWSVPSTQHAWSYAHLHICIVFKSAWVDTRRDWGAVGRNSNGAAGYIVSPVHEIAGGLRPETWRTSECLGEVNRKFISQSHIPPMDPCKFRVKGVSRNSGVPGAMVSPLLMPRFSGKHYVVKLAFSVVSIKGHIFTLGCLS